MWEWLKEISSGCKTVKEHFCDLTYPRVTYVAQGIVKGKAQKVNQIKGKVQQLNIVKGKAQKINPILGKVQVINSVKGKVNKINNIKGSVKCQNT